MPSKPQTFTLKLAEITADPGVQQRAGGLDAAWVAELAEVCRSAGKRATAPFKDKPLCFFDGTTYWLAAGFHRLAGAEAAGLKALDCTVMRGGRRDALLHALADNADHGKGRTPADKRKAVVTALEDAEWGKLSDRKIAELCKVDASWVGTVRREWRDVPPDPAKQRFKKQEQEPAAPEGAGGPHPEGDPEPAADAGAVATEPEAEPEAEAEHDSPPRPAAAAKPEPPPDTYLKGVLDGRDRPVPDRLAAEFTAPAADFPPGQAPHLVCLSCRGAGKQQRRDCPACSGRGWLSAADLVGLSPELREALETRDGKSPDGPARALAQRAKFDLAASLLRRAARVLDELCNGPGGHFLRRYGEYRDRELVRVFTEEKATDGTGRIRYRAIGVELAYRAVTAAAPDVRCAGRFPGQTHADHAECQGQGWVPESRVLRGNSEGIQLELPEGDPWDDRPAA